MSGQAGSPVSFNVDVRRLPKKGVPVVVEADAGARAALAGTHGLEEVRRFRAELLVAGWKRDGVMVSGRVEADIVQACVVTLEPLAAEIGETVSAVFLPAHSQLARGGREAGGEVLLDPDGPDAPEILEGDTIDVGALAEEFFALAIDPYPRGPRASLEDGLASSGQEGPRGPLFEKLRGLGGKS